MIRFLKIYEQNSNKIQMFYFSKVFTYLQLRKINYLFLKVFEKYLPIAKVSAYPRTANLDAQ